MIMKKVMKRVSSIFASMLVTALTLSAVTAMPVQAATELFVNQGFEDGTTTGFSTQGDNIKAEVSSEDAHDGNYALKVTGRKTADEMPFQTLAGDQITFGEWYEFSVWVKPSYTVWCALITTPWAVGAESGGIMWNDSYGDQKVCEAGQWTQLKCQYRLVLEEDKLYVENGFDRVVAKNHAGTGDVTFVSLQQVDFKVNAEPGADVLIVDDFSLIPVSEITGETSASVDESKDEPEEIPEPEETPEVEETPEPEETPDVEEPADEPVAEPASTEASNVGIYVGIGVVVVAAVAAGIFVWKRRSSK